MNSLTMSFGVVYPDDIIPTSYLRTHVTLPLKLRRTLMRVGANYIEEFKNYLKDDIIIENKNDVIIIDYNIAYKDTTFLQSQGKLRRNNLSFSPVLTEPVPQPSTLSTTSPGKDS